MQLKSIESKVIPILGHGEKSGISENSQIPTCDVFFPIMAENINLKMFINVSCWLDSLA